MLRKLTGDQSASANLSESEIDERVKEMLDTEYADLIWDLRIQNDGRPEEYEEYLEKVQQFIERSVETSVQECRHDITEDSESVSYIATCCTSFS